jgi:DNA-binding MarR family transcriptional regulator
MEHNAELTRHWTFLSNHGHVLIQLNRDPNLRIRDIAQAVGITERSAQAILVDLEKGGYLTVTRVGRRNQYQINPNSKFRHPAEDEKPVSALLKIFS